MRFISIVLAALATIAFAGQADARNAPIEDPAPISVPAGLDSRDVAREIKRALFTRGWEVTGETAGNIEGTLHLRTHMAKIAITYDTSKVSIRYLDSNNLDYKERKGQRTIHRNYNGWIGFLVNDIRANLKVTALDNQG